MSLNVLIGEDNADYAACLVDLLRKAGHAAEVFPDGLAAFHAFKENRFDVAILDIALPKLSGLEILQKITGTPHALPVLVLTAHGDPEVHDRALSTGASVFLQKSADPADILRHVAALGRRRHV
ncbi:MAG: response regulator [Planctomycetes bacterium]|nr:response regulator [Planctomycetota bacterium]